MFDTYFDNYVSGLVWKELFISRKFVFFSPGWTLYSLMCGGCDGGGPGVCMSSILKIFNGTATSARDVPDSTPILARLLVLNPDSLEY